MHTQVSARKNRKKRWRVRGTEGCLLSLLQVRGLRQGGLCAPRESEKRQHPVSPSAAWPLMSHGPGTRTCQAAGSQPAGLPGHGFALHRRPMSVSDMGAAEGGGRV